MPSIHFALTSAFLLSLSASAFADQPKLDLNDVSWLWPAPQTVADLSRVITIGELKSECGEHVWSDSQFKDLLRTVDSEAVKVGSDKIEFGPAIRDKAVWRIAGMRADPSAPGGSSAIRASFGSIAQIRLIVQPVTVSGGKVVVHDVAVHLVYDYTTGDDADNRKIPDHAKFLEIVADLDRVKRISQLGGAPTAGQPLGVHPGLKANTAGVADAMSDLLSKHLSHLHLQSMALMGIQSGIEPWIFIAMTRLPTGFAPIPFPIPAAAPQMLDFRSLGGKVSPDPIVNNRSPITGERIVAEKDRRGVSTTVLFGPPPNMNAFAVIGKDAAGNVVRDTEVRNSDIPDVIADPIASHFFNTDCVSCHSETRRRLRLKLLPGDFAFKVSGQPPQIAADVLPADDWNVRNFGWFTPSVFIGGGPAVGTVTQRTANETAEVVEFIERNFRSNN